jgi:hypothetical protein
MRTSSIRSIFGLAFALISAVAVQSAPALVGHSGLSSESLDADAVKAVLLGKKVTLGSTRVVIVIAKSSEGQEQFLGSTVGMTTSQFQNHWRRLFMTGGGSAPKVVENEEEACKILAETAGAVAIIDSAKAGTLVVLSGAK